MKVFDVLNPLQQVDGALFLEAAAGCGKTFAIEHILIRLILEHDVSIENCLVVTFTKAAAVDLKKRIFSTLLKIEEALMSQSGNLSSFPYLEGIKENKKGLIAIQKAIEGLNFAPITTIHGFCKRFLTQEAFDVGLPFCDESDLDLDEKILDSIRAIDSKKFPAIWLEQLKEAQISLENSLLRLIKRNLAHEFVLKPFPDFPSLYQEFVEIILEYQALDQKSSKTPLEDIYIYFSGFYTKQKEFKYQKEAQLLNNVLVHQNPSLELFEQFLGIKDFLEDIDEANLLRKSLKDPKILEICHEKLALLRPLKELLKKALNPSLIAFQLILKMQEDLKEHLSQNPLLLPDFLLKQMQKVIQQETVKKRLQKLFQVVLIDEFQDTDPIQWEIFETVFFNAPALKLFACVGDPKQSIYAFRNADIEIYLKAKNRFPSESRYILDTNFRSEKKVIEALNFCFKNEGDISFFNFDNSPYAIDYFPIKARHEKLWEPEDCKSALHFISGLEIERKKQEEALFFSIAKEYYSLVDQNVNPEEIAFLVKDRNQAERLKLYLAKKGIQTPPLKIDLLCDSNSYKFMKAVIDYFDNFYDDHALKRMLFHPFLRKDQYFSEIFIEHDFKLLKQQLIDGDELEKTPFSFLKFFTQILEKHAVYEKLLREKSYQDYEELTQLVEWFLNQIHQTANFEKLKKKFLEIEKLTDEDADGVKKRTFSLEPMPQLMTMHASKGLEFDIVFILGLYVPTKNHALFYKTEEADKKRWTIDHPENPALHEVPIDMEKMRQFYVAATRAKKRAYIPLIDAYDEENPNLGSLSPLQLFLRKKALNTSNYQTLYDKAIDCDLIYDFIRKIPQASLELIKVEESEIEPRVKKEVKVDPIAPILKPLEFFQKKSVSFSSLLEKEITHKEPVLNTTAVGADFGTFVHNLFEKTIENRFYDKTHTEEFKNWLRLQLEKTAYEEEIEEIFLMIHQAMNIPLIDQTIKIKDLPYQALMPEMKLNLNLNEDLQLSGFIDLLIFFDGQYYIVDYKTNFLGQEAVDYQHNNLMEAVKENDYFLQAACYAKALEAFVKKIHQKPFEKVFKGVSFLFLRGLKFHEGVITFSDVHKLNEKFDDALLSRT